jgi:hypothetical protein
MDESSKEKSYLKIDPAGTADRECGQTLVSRASRLVVPP